MSKDKYELNDEELDAVSGGVRLNRESGVNNTNANTRTSESEGCDQFVKAIGKPNLYKCGCCKYFHKVGNSGVCQNQNGNNKNQKTVTV